MNHFTFSEGSLSYFNITTTWQVSVNVVQTHMVVSVLNVNLASGTSQTVSDVSVMAMLTHVTLTLVSVITVVTIPVDQTVLSKFGFWDNILLKYIY